jgi:hypothetical protein
MTSDQARQWAEKSFKQEEERVRDGKKATTAYEAEALAVRAKTERLKALRLAKEAQAATEEQPASQPGRPSGITSPATRNNSSLNFAALHPSHAANSAPLQIVCGAFLIQADL